MNESSTDLTGQSAEPLEDRIPAQLAAASSAATQGRLDISWADLSEAVPVIPDIDAAILAAIEAPGCRLDMSDWHGCGTTHCRAGWAIHLAGKSGKELQDKYGPFLAGSLIYRASRPNKPAPWFHAPTDKALADIRKCAAAERASYPELSLEPPTNALIKSPITLVGLTTLEPRVGAEGRPLASGIKADCWPNAGRGPLGNGV